MFDYLPETNPRLGLNATANGHYDFIARVTNSILNNGDFLTVEIFITGYGEIGNSKFAFYPSKSVIDLTESEVSFGIKNEIQPDGNFVMSWGGMNMKFTEIGNDGLALDLSRGLVRKFWAKQEATIFFDTVQRKTPQIMSEVSHFETAPIVFRLKINNKTSSGTYSLHFGFTYFNGHEWNGTNQQIPFTVRTVFQRHESLIAWIGFVGVLLATIAAVYSIIDLGIKYWPFSDNKIEQKNISQIKTDTIKENTIKITTIKNDFDSIQKLQK